MGLYGAVEILVEIAAFASGIFVAYADAIPAFACAHKIVPALVAATLTFFEQSSVCAVVSYASEVWTSAFQFPVRRTSLLMVEGSLPRSLAICALLVPPSIPCWMNFLSSSVKCVPFKWTSFLPRNTVRKINHGTYSCK